MTADENLPKYIYKYTGKEGVDAILNGEFRFTNLPIFINSYKDTPLHDENEGAIKLQNVSLDFFEVNNPSNKYGSAQASEFKIKLSDMEQYFIFCTSMSDNLLEHFKQPYCLRIETRKLIDYFDKMFKHFNVQCHYDEVKYYNPKTGIGANQGVNTLMLNKDNRFEKEKEFRFIFRTNIRLFVEKKGVEIKQKEVGGIIDMAKGNTFDIDFIELI